MISKYVSWNSCRIWSWRIEGHQGTGCGAGNTLSGDALSHIIVPSYVPLPSSRKTGHSRSLPSSEKQQISGIFNLIRGGGRGGSTALRRFSVMPTRDRNGGSGKSNTMVILCLK